MANYVGNIEVDITNLYKITGPNVDVESASLALDRASDMVETLSGVVFEGEFRETPVSNADVGWIRKAIVFQAAWLMDNEEVLNVTATKTQSQDGLSFSAFNETSYVLAPMAKRALSNCSWNKTSTRSTAKQRNQPIYDYAVSDDHAWYPLGGN